VGIKGCPNGRHRDALSFGNIGRPAHDLHSFIVTDIHSGDAQLVCIGMPGAGQHFPDHHTFQSALHGLDLFDPFHLQAGIGKYSSKFNGIQIEICILPEPVIGNLHFALSLKICK
jgi:hypothetical protein